MAHDYRIAFFCKHKQRTLYALYIAWALERLGCTVKHVNPHKVKRFLGRRLADAWVRRSVRRFRPDAIIFFSRDIFPETLAALRGRPRSPRSSTTTSR